MMISIIIPVYNAERYIAACLDSCLEQTYTDFDIILINDGSTDNSLLIIERYVNLSHKIRIITTPNRGLVAARGRGVKESKSDYIFFLDSDDTIIPNALELLWNEVCNTYADIVVGNITTMLESGKVISVSRNYSINPNAVNSLFCSMLMGTVTPSLCGRLIRRSVFDGVEVPRGYTIGEDVITNLLIVEAHNPTYVLCNHAIYNYIQHCGSMVNTHTLGNAQHRMRFILWVNQYLAKIEPSDDIRRASSRFFLDEYFSFLRDGGSPNTQPVITDMVNNKYLSNDTYTSLIPVWRIMMLRAYRCSPVMGGVYRWLFIKLRAVIR